MVKIKANGILFDMQGTLIGSRNAIPGSQNLLNSLPKSQWGVVTSSGSSIASKWLKQTLHVDVPDVFITGEVVSKGKPDPEGYKLGAERLGASKFIVFEDSSSGIRAGKAAGGIVVGLGDDKGDLIDSGADYAIRDFNNVKLANCDKNANELTLEIN